MLTLLQPFFPQRITASTEKNDAIEATMQPRLEEAKPPPMYQVLLINDDFTPMEFVVLILQEFFNKDMQEATNIMYQVHTEGRGVCGIYPRDIAQTKTHQVMESARQAGHPLQCVFDPVPE